MRRMPTTERGSAMTLKTRVAVLVLAIVLVMTVGAIGQGSYPNKPITLVTHSSVGAGGDIFLRNLARHLEGIVNVKPAAPWQTLQDIVNTAKQRPGTIRFGAATPGSVEHMIAHQIQKVAKIQVQPVTFEGGGDLLLAVLDRKSGG